MRNKQKQRLIQISMGLLLVAVFLGGLAIAVGETAVSPASASENPFPVVEMPPEAQYAPIHLLNGETIIPAHPKMDSSLANLTTADSPQEVEEIAGDSGLRLEGDQVQIQVVTSPEILETTTRAIKAAGGSVTGQYDDGTLLQAWAPITQLNTLAQDTAVRYIRQPAQLALTDVSATTEGLAALNGAPWHNAGFTGSGVKIAIIDGGFQGYPGLLGSDLPANVTIKNFVDGEGDGQVNGTTVHGTACTEIVHDIAPNAQLYLVKIGTDIDLQEAVNYVLSQNVDVITTSLGWYNLTPGDGTGFFANLTQQARNNGVVWITAASNDRENHWGGLFNDPNNNGFHNFNGTQEVNYFGPGNGNAYNINPGFLMRVYLRWDDWTQVNQNYDLLALRWNGSSWQQIGASANGQNGAPGQTPTEFVGVATSGAAAPYGFVIQRVNSNRNVNFEIFTPKFPRMDELVTARSLSNLADSPGAITVAAVDVTSPYPQEEYSSEGPTNGPGGTINGGITKPDLSAYANVSTESYGAGGFNGTSSAAPHVAGAAALVLDAFPGYTPNDVQNFLQGRAQDLGPSGLDTRYGYGRVYLGAPPAGSTVTPTFTPTPANTATPTPTMTATPFAPNSWTYLPVILYGLLPTPTSGPTATATMVIPASMEVDNQTGGIVLVELINYGSHFFPEDISTWNNITPGTYNAKVTALGGACVGQSLNRQYAFEPGITLSVTYSCVPAAAGNEMSLSSVTR